jgi:DNA-binding winged helix-turn-helix (wHTH) protein
MRTGVFRFGGCVLDVPAYELRRQGRSVRLERRPMELLLVLVDCRGELLTRDEIVARLWGRDVFIDIDTSVNTAIRKVRRALRDSAEESHFVQTVQGKGYRFIADVEATTSEVLARPGAGRRPALLAEVEEASRLRYVPPYAIALVHAGLNDDRRAFESLERAAMMRDAHLIYVIVDPNWDRLRRARRFQELLRRSGLSVDARRPMLG